MVQLLVLLALMATTSRADSVLAEGAKWRLNFSGFIEADLTQDSQPSFLESAGNYPVQGPYTPAGQANQTRREYSLRNSRLGFALVPKETGAWNPKAYVEFDFLGNRASWQAGGSKSDYFNDPSLRFRHYYLSAEHEGWKFLTGQYWTQFGWASSYLPTTASVAPGPGILYQRTRQVNVQREFVSDEHNVQLALSFEKATSKAGGVPNLVAGARYAYSGLKSGYASAGGEAKTESLSAALTGTLRQFGYNSTNAADDKFRKVSAGAGAFDVLIPLIVSSDGKSTDNTLTLTAEASTGTGYGDALPGWSANLPDFPYDSNTTDTYLAQGEGGFDSHGEFHLFKLVTWNAQLQYHLWNSFANVGHSELSASNVGGLGPVPTGQTPYDRTKMDFVNLFHDFSGHLRGAIEYAHFSTRYLGGSNLSDDRYQLTGLYRF